MTLKPPKEDNILRPPTIREQMEADLKGIYDTVELDFFNDKSASWLLCKNKNSKKAMCFTFNYEGTHLNRLGLYKQQLSGEEQIYSVHNKEDYPEKSEPPVKYDPVKWEWWHCA